MYAWLAQFLLFLFPRHASGINASNGEASLENRPVGDQPIQHARDPERGPQPGLTRKTIDLVSSRLDHGRAALQQACNRTEADFLSMGERLQAIFARAEQMTRMALAAVDHIGVDADQTALATITRTAYQALDDFAMEQSKIDARSQHICSICGYLHNLYRLAGGLGRIAKDLKMVAININIESSRAVESRESFSILSEEIRTLSNTVAALALTLRSEIQAMTAKLEAMQAAMDANLSRFSRLANDARQVADHAVPECRVLMERAVNVLQLVGTNGEVISRSTGQIVVSLQIHDTVSQRIAHIAEALADARQLLLQLDPGSQDDQNQLEPVAAVDANLDLQQEQLANIIADIDQVFRDATQAFEVIGDTVRDTTASILQIAGSAGSNHAKGNRESGSIRSLKDGLEKIRVLVSQGDETVDELKAIGGDAAAAVSRIGDHMDQIRKVNFDIHLKSLNAFFKSTQLGDSGRSIGVLVQEMKALATQSNDLVEKIETINKAIKDQADQLQAGLGADDQEKTAINAEALDASMQAFSESGMAFTRDADEMAGLSRILSEAIMTAGNQLTFLKPFAETLRSHQDQFNACRVNLAPWVIHGDTAAFDQARMAERYTMEQERIIHTAILKGKAAKTHDLPGTAVAAVSGTVASPEFRDDAGGNDFGDNVELF